MRIKKPIASVIASLAVSSVTVVVFAASVSPIAGEAPSLLPDGREFKLVWNDEFNGTSLDESKWSYRTNFWGRRFAAFAAPDQGAVEVKDGKVHLKLIKLPNGEFAAPQLQTGGLMWDIPQLNPTNAFWYLPKREKPKFEKCYGYFECRCRLQQKPGWWCAFWMQTEIQGTCLDPARAGIEHDIMESFEPGVVIPAAFHMNGYGADYVGFHCPRYSGKGTFLAQTEEVSAKVDKTVYHTFGMLWEPDGYTLYIDGVQRGEKVGRGKNHKGLDEAVSQVPEFILITTEPKLYRANRMTGRGVPELQDAWKAGDEFIVDYVRVYDVVN